MRALRADELEVGRTFELVVVRDLRRSQLVQYAGASGDFHPFHSDEPFALAAGSPRGVFAHGMWTMGATARVLTDAVGDGRLTSYEARFVGQVWPGDTLDARARVESLRRVGDLWWADFSVETRNQDGEVVLVGRATARLDPPAAV